MNLDNAAGVLKAFSSADVDIGKFFSAPLFARVDVGDPIILAGVHIGCFDLFATDRVGRIRDAEARLLR